MRRARGGKEFTCRLPGLRKRAATGNHDSDRRRAEPDIAHRLAPPMRLQSEEIGKRSR